MGVGVAEEQRGWNWTTDGLLFTNVSIQIQVKNL